MATPTLRWTLNKDRGTINFGRLIAFAGNTYPLVILDNEGENVGYTAYVMSEDGLKCLAKSQNVDGALTIAFNTSDLRDEFEREMHEMRVFHCVIRDADKTVAEGDIALAWNPLWKDTETGEVFTMRGPKGDTGEQGRRGLQGMPGASVYEIAQKNGFTGSEEDFLQSLKGVPGSMVRVQKLDAEGNETGKWHDIYVTLDSSGRLRLVVDKTEKEAEANEDIYVNRVLDVTVSGVKTFLVSPIVPNVADVNDDSGKAVSTSFLKKWWESAKQAAQSISGIFTFSKRIVVKDDERTEETLRVDAKEHTATFSGKLVANGVEEHSGEENHHGNETHAGALSVTGSIEDRTLGNLKTFTDLTSAETEIEKSLNTIFDAEENIIGEDKVYNNAEGVIGRIIGGVRRAIGRSLQTCFIKLGISTSGESIIQLYGDHIHGTTEERGTNNTTLATTAFVRDHSWVYPDDAEETAIDSGEIAWPGVGNWQTGKDGMLVWSYTAQEDGFLYLLVSAEWYYNLSGFWIDISKTDGTGKYRLLERTNMSNQWNTLDASGIYPLQAGQKLEIYQKTYYPSKCIAKFWFYSKV